MRNLDILAAENGEHVRVLLCGEEQSYVVSCQHFQMPYPVASDLLAKLQPVPAETYSVFVLDAATDSFVSSVIAALNQYTVDLAKEQIRLAFAQAQKEVDDLHQRTREGMLTAKLNGKQIGQECGRKLIVKKAATCKEAIKKYSKDFDGTLSDADCIKLIGIARNTYYKYKRELREAMPV